MNDKVSKEAIFRKWKPKNKSANAMIKELPGYIAKSRDLHSGNGIATSIIETYVDKVIGSGLEVIPNIDYKTLGWFKTNSDGKKEYDEDRAKEWNEKAKRLWELFSQSNLIDVSEKLNFDGISRLALSSSMLNGEVIALSHWSSNPNSLFRTQIQLVEADRLRTPDKLVNDKYVKAGIRLDKSNRPIKYYISKTYPDDNIFSKVEFNEISSKTKFGRKKVIHLYEQKRVDQLRGKPIFTPVLTQFKKLDMYEEAELSAAVVSAMIALIITTPEKTDKELMQIYGLDTEEEVSELRADWDRSLSSGNVLQLFNGETAQGFAPNRPNSAFTSFVEHIIKNICVASGLSYEVVMKDFSKCNYSSARAALQEAWEKILVVRSWFKTNFVKEIYSLFLEEAANRGYIDVPDFYKYKEAYLRFTVHGPTKGVLDPVKEAKASIMLIQAGLSSKTHESAKLGNNIDDVFNRVESEQDEIKRRGLMLASNAELVELVKSTNDENEEDESENEKN